MHQKDMSILNLKAPLIFLHNIMRVMILLSMTMVLLQSILRIMDLMAMTMVLQQSITKVMKNQRLLVNLKAMMIHFMEILLSMKVKTPLW